MLKIGVSKIAATFDQDNVDNICCPIALSTGRDGRSIVHKVFVKVGTASFLHAPISDLTLTFS